MTEQAIFISDDRCPVAREIAAWLIKQNKQVFLNQISGEEVPGAVQTKLDLTDYDAIKTRFKTIGSSLCSVIIPAPPLMISPVETATEDQWLHAFQQGALASIQLTRAAGQHLAEIGRGSVIYLGSIHAEKPVGHGFLYSTNCAATQMLCHEAALDYGRKGVSFFYIQRGIIADDLKYANSLSNLHSSTATRYPRQQMPEPDSLNQLISFLLSEGAAPLNGSVLRADEGLTLFYGHQFREEGAR